MLQNHANKSNQAFFTFVALDDRSMKPKAVPSVIPESDDEKKLYDGAAIRREFRLVVSGRMTPSEATQSKVFLNQI